MKNKLFYQDVFKLNFSLQSHLSTPTTEPFTPAQLTSLYLLLQDLLYKPASHLYHADPTYANPAKKQHASSYLKGRSAVDVEYENVMRA